MVAVRNDVTYPGFPGAEKKKGVMPPCAVTSPATADRDWIPIVARLGLTVITRDSQILNKKAEIDAVCAHGVRMAVIATRDTTSKFDQLRIVLRHWDDIESLHVRSGPRILRMLRASCADMEL